MVEPLRGSEAPILVVEVLNEPTPVRAKHLPLLPWEPAPLALPELPELVPARMINEVLYCERLMYLEWAQGEFADNAFTVHGRQVHKRADQPGGEAPPLPTKAPTEAAVKPSAKAKSKADSEEEDDEDPQEDETPPYQARSLWISSETLGITGKIDIVEGDGEGQVTPIEFKRGVAPDLPEGAYLPERAQLAAQGMLLREQGYSCTGGFIWFHGSKKRVAIPFTADLEATVKKAVARARELAISGRLPPPLVDSPKCYGCSLVGICLPDETNALALEAAAEAKDKDKALPSEDQEPPTPQTDDDSAPLRRLYPARDEALPLYVQEQGAKVGLSGELIVVYSKTGKVEARLSNTSQVALFGNIQISTQALRTLMDREIPVSFLSTGGWFVGRAIIPSPTRSFNPI